MDFFILSNSSLLKKLNIKTLEKYDGYFVNNQASLKQTCCVWRGKGGEGLDPPFSKQNFTWNLHIKVSRELTVPILFSSVKNNSGYFLLSTTQLRKYIRLTTPPPV